MVANVNHHMNRRNAIRVTALGIFPFSGCLSNTLSGPSPPNDRNRFPNVSIDNVSTDITKTRFQASVVHDFTSDHPARIRVKFENTGPERTFSFGSSPPFSSYWGSHKSAESTLVLVPEDREYVRSEGNNEEEASLVPSTPKDGCWEMATNLFREDIGQEVTVGTGQIVQEEYDLLSAASNKNCLPAGTYQFLQQNPQRKLTIQVTD